MHINSYMYMLFSLSLSLNLLQDFGDSIPGHGGMTDRMDCQVSHAKHYEMFGNRF